MSERRPVPVRREPPAFRPVNVVRTERRSDRLVRVTLGGPALDGFALDEPAASVRVLLPLAGTGELVIPEWNGNEFLLPDGTRPPIRTLTPRRFDPEAVELDVEIVVHGGGAASEWATAARASDRAAVSGPGRGYSIDHDAPSYLLAGDETAIPAMSQLLEALSPDMTVEAHIEIAAPEARVDMPAHARATTDWHELPDGAPPGETIVEAVRHADIPADSRVWVAGEAAAVQRVRKYLFEDRGLSRRQASVRGYWKHGRAASTRDDE